MKIIKRDGRIQNYNFSKIENVIYKVFNSKSVSTPVPDKLISQLEDLFDKIVEKSKSKGPDYAMHIEEIQDTIRDFLINKKQHKAAESFILYRDKRNREREKNSWLSKEISKRIKDEGIQNQNANVDEGSFGGKKGEIISAVMSDFALKNLVSKITRKNFEDNMVYPHDKDSYATGEHNCLSEPFDKMLNMTIKTRQADIRRANSINTACQLVAVYFQLQSLQQFGGVSSTHLDWTLVPFLRKSFEKHYVTQYIYSCEDFMSIDILNISDPDLDAWISNKTAEFFLKFGLKEEDFKFENKDKFNPEWYQFALADTRKELYQAMEGLFHNLNTLQSRSGNQLPFSSINYGTCTLPEGRLIIKSILETSIKGTGPNGTTSIFPCGIFQYMKGVNDKPGTPNYDLKRLALRSLAKRIYPNFANCDWSNQISQINEDRRTKASVIDSLLDVDREKLIEIIEKDPELGKKLSLRVVED